MFSTRNFFRPFSTTTTPPPEVASLTGTGYYRTVGFNAP